MQNLTSLSQTSAGNITCAGNFTPELLSGMSPYANASVGNQYFIGRSTAAAQFAGFSSRHSNTTYYDGTPMFYSDPATGAGIQSAITASLGSYNNYFFVAPGTYTLAAELTAAGKSGVHLIAVNGGSMSVGATTSVYLIQGGSFAALRLSANTEVTGFAIKNKASYSAIVVPASIFSTHIHHNYFLMVMGAAINIIDCSASVANKMGRIEFNRFNGEVTGSLTSAINCTSGYAQDVCNNELSFHSAGTVDYGIFNDSTGGMTNDNKISGSNGVVITTAIYVSQYGSAIGNRCAVGAGYGIGGGTDEQSFVDNRDGVAGGASAIET